VFGLGFSGIIPRLAFRCMRRNTNVFGRLGSFVPTIIVNGDGRYFASPAGRPSHVSYATAHEAQQYAEQRAADLHRTVDFLMASGFITPLPRA
jgi:hypothetical protein